jgi:glycosyltransferase involved in cell wall biosynthesis
VKEAMAAGLAVVAVDVGDVRERLQGVSGTRITADERPEALAREIMSVFDGNERRDGVRAIESLGLEVVATRIIGLYERVIGANICRPNATS